MIEKEPNVGIVGTHVRNSLSQAMHNAAYREMGVDFNYGVFQVPQLDSADARAEFLDAFLSMQAENGVVGMSVTMPFKEEVVISNEVTDLSDSVLVIGAANTLTRISGGGWKADNTDWLGITAALEDAGVSLQRKVGLIIGAGGTARAAAYGLGSLKARQVFVVNRTNASANDLVEGLQPNTSQTQLYALPLEHFSPRLDGVRSEFVDSLDIVINTTSIGQDGTEGEDRIPVSRKLIDGLKPGATVMDVVYMPLDTPLLRRAQERDNLSIVNGTRMLLFQAVEQVRIFTGIEDVPIQVMEAAATKELSRRHYLVD